MLVHLLDLETERRHREEAGASAIREEFAKVKENLIFTGFDSGTVRDWMIELAVWAEQAFGDCSCQSLHKDRIDQCTIATQSLDIVG
jgi:hypothetical protein